MIENAGGKYAREHKTYNLRLPVIDWTLLQQSECLVLEFFSTRTSRKLFKTPQHSSFLIKGY